MSMSPDNPSFLSRLSNGIDGTLNNVLYSPGIGVAAGLLDAGGPSRLPVSLGQAIGRGLLTGQQFQSAGLQNLGQRMALGQNLMRLQYMLNPPSMMPQSSQPSAPSMPSTPPMPPGMLSPPGMSAPPSMPPVQPQVKAAPSPQAAIQVDTRMPPEQMVTAPVNYADPMSDPYYNYLAGGARLGLPGWDTLAGQRQTFLLQQPGFQAAQERAKAQAQFYNIRQGGALMDASGNIIRQVPKLPEGATLNNDDTVSMVPGALGAIGASEKAAAQGGLYGKPAEGVIPSGPNAGGTYQTTVGDLRSGNAGMPNLTALPPAQSGGMADAGKAATDRANEAITQQLPAQQQLSQLAQLETNLNALGTGPGKETQLAVKKGLASVGGFFGVPGLANVDLTNAAAARKTIVGMVAPAVRAMGAREPYQMVSFIKDGMASISNPADANAIVIGMYRGLAQYRNDTGKFASTWLNYNNGAGFQPGQGAWDGVWQNRADPTAYILENLPAFERNAIFQQASRNPQLAAELKRAQASAPWLIKNGYLRDSGE